MSMDSETLHSHKASFPIKERPKTNLISTKTSVPNRLSCPPIGKPSKDKIGRQVSSVNPLLEKTKIKAKHASLEYHKLPALSATSSESNSKLKIDIKTKKLSLSKAPTPEAIAGLSQELDDIERSLNGIPLDIFQDTTDSFDQNNSLTISNKAPSSRSLKRLSKEASMARHLMRENARLLKKVDRLEYDLSQTRSRLKFGTNMELSSQPIPVSDVTKEENVPLVVMALKSKLAESEEIIAQQCRQLESQDLRAIDLEKRLRALTDSFLVGSGKSNQLNHRTTFGENSFGPTYNRSSILMIDDQPTSSLFQNNLNENTVRNFVSDLFMRECSFKPGNENLKRALKSPVTISPSGEQTPLPLYSTGMLNEPLFPIAHSTPKVSTPISTPNVHSRNSSFNQVIRSISISSLAKDTLPDSVISKNSQPTIHVSSPPKETALTNSLQSTVQGLESALQESYQQHTSLRSSLAQLQSRLESSDMQLARQKENHKQGIDSLMDQIERSKLESASYQRQFQDVSRQNYTLNTQLEEALARLSALEEKRSRFLCFG